MIRRILAALDDARMLIAAGGLRGVAPLLVGALLVTVVYRDGTIRTLGPLVFSPELRVLVVVPLALAVAVAGAHAGTGTPVVVRNARVALARALSYVSVLALSVGILTLGGWFAEQGVAWGALRTLLLFSASGLLGGALVGPSMAWAPVVVLFGLAVTSQTSEDPWTIFALVLREDATTAQLVVTATAWLVGLAVAVTNPRGFGYLPRTARR